MENKSSKSKLKIAFYTLFILANFSLAYLIINSIKSISNPISTITIILSISALILIWGIFGFTKIILTSQKNNSTIQSVLTLFLEPERIKTEQAHQILQDLISKELDSVNNTFKNMTQTLDEHFNKTIELENTLKLENEKLSNTITEISNKMSETINTVHKNIENFNNTLNSETIKQLQDNTLNFENSINSIYSKTNEITTELSENNAKMIANTNELMSVNKALSENITKTFTDSNNKFNAFVVNIDNLNQKISTTIGETSLGFKEMQNESKKLSQTLDETQSNLETSKESLKTYTEQTIIQLQTQVRNINATANSVSGQIRLAESSLVNQENGLKEALSNLMECTQTLSESVKNLSSDVTSISVSMQKQIQAFSTDVVLNMNKVGENAQTTISQTQQATTMLSQSVNDMNTNIAESMGKVFELHNKFSSDSVNLLKLSHEISEQLSPVAGIMTSYQQTLPKISNETKEFLHLFSNQITEFETKSKEASANLSSKMAALDVQINSITNSASLSAKDIESITTNLENISKNSVSEIGELLNNYKSLLSQFEQTNNKMNFTLAKQKVLNKETENLNTTNVKQRPTSNNATQIDLIANKLHTISMDLALLTGTTISENVWNKYNSGNQTIFSDWLSAMLNKADKGKIKAILKSDDSFRQKASNFIKGFENILEIINSMENSSALKQTIANTNLGNIYNSLKKFL